MLQTKGAGILQNLRNSRQRVQDAREMLSFINSTEFRNSEELMTRFRNVGEKLERLIQGNEKCKKSTLSLATSNDLKNG